MLWHILVQTAFPEYFYDLQKSVFIQGFFHTWTQTYPKHIESKSDLKMSFAVGNGKYGCEWFCLPHPISYLTSAKKQFPSLVKTGDSSPYTHFTDSSNCLVVGHVTQTRLTGISPRFSSKGNVRVFFHLCLARDLIKYLFTEGDCPQTDRVKLSIWRRRERDEERKRCAKCSLVLIFILLLLEVWTYEIATYWLLHCLMLSTCHLSLHY